MSSQKIYMYNVLCDECGCSKMVEGSSDRFRFEYITPSDQLLGWTEQSEESTGFRGMKIYHYYHYCPDCAPKQKD